MTHKERELLSLAAYTITLQANNIQATLTQADITADLVSNINQCLQQIDNAMAIACDIITSQPIPLPTTHLCQACGAELPPSTSPIWDEYSGIMLCEACAMTPAYPESNP